MSTQSILPRAHLKVLSSICTNLVAGWIAALFFTSDIIILLRNLVFAVLFWHIAIELEKYLNNYD